MELQDKLSGADCRISEHRSLVDDVGTAYCSRWPPIGACGWSVDACGGHGKVPNEHDQDPRRTIQTVLRQQQYDARRETKGKVVARYHLLGSHGGA